jgi:hypothetical protein
LNGKRKERESCPLLLLRLDQVVGNGEEGKFKACGDTGFVEDIGEMAFDGFFAE